VAIEPPGPDLSAAAMPEFTTRMVVSTEAEFAFRRQVARIRSFPDDWAFSDHKTAAYRQVGNAFPPPVARAIGQAIHDALVAPLQ
jgi:site-specific DNA-cytosine methylase